MSFIHKWEKRAMNFLKRARILLIKFNDFPVLIVFLRLTVNGYISNVMKRSVHSRLHSNRFYLTFSGKYWSFGQSIHLSLFKFETIQMYIKLLHIKNKFQIIRCQILKFCFQRPLTISLYKLIGQTKTLVSKYYFKM